VATAYKYDINGNPIPVGAVINGSHQGAWFESPEDAAAAKAQPTASDQDYAKGMKRGQEIFYNDPDMIKLRENQEELAKGYSGAELGARQASARESIQGERSKSLKSLQSRVGRAGIGGARAAAMQGEADKGFVSANADNERKMLLDDANLKRTGNQGLQDFIFRQKYGALGSAINEQQTGVTERGNTAAANANKNSGGGPSWICSEVHKHAPWNFGEMKALNKLRNHALENDPINARIYFEQAHKLIANMNAKNYDWLKLKPSLDAVIAMVKAGDTNFAYDHYKTVTISLAACFGV